MKAKRLNEERRIIQRMSQTAKNIEKSGSLVEMKVNN
jgi:hypothetical protein